MTRSESPLVARRRERTRAEITLAALELAEDEGFSATTVDDIALRAGVSVRTFYRYCSDKVDALAAEMETFPTLFAHHPAQLPPEGSVAEAVRLSIHAAMASAEVLEVRRRIIVVMQSEPQLRERWFEAWRSTRLTVIESLSRWPSVREQNPLLVHAGAGALVGVMSAVIEFWVTQQREDLESELCDALDAIGPTVPGWA